MTADMPDATQVAREAVAAFYDANDLKALCEVVLSGGLDNNANYPVRGAILGARAMQAAMAAPAGVREDYAAICKELGCIEKPGVPLRFIQEMRKNLTAAGERIDWLLRSWDDATITERQELDRMRRGWGPTTPTERMLRHRDLRDCMQALSGALTDLTTPEDDNAEPEVEARLQEAYGRVNERYLASLEILRRLDEPLERPDLEPAGAREGAEVPEPLYKRVEAILDEHSAWIARPNDEVTKRVALAAMFAAHAVLIEEEAPEDRYLRDGVTHAPAISEETINTVRAHAIYNATHGGMPQAEAEAHFGTPIPAGAGDLVERLRQEAHETKIGGPTWGDGSVMEEAASRIEALEAEVAEKTAEMKAVMGHIPMDYLQRHDTPGATGPTAALKLSSAMRDYAEDRWKLIDRVKASEARATTAEAERDAWRERESETQEALQKIGEEFGFMGGEPRVDGLHRALTEMRAERDALKAEAERLEGEYEALSDTVGKLGEDLAGAKTARNKLQAEVERKDKALREAGEAIAEYFRYLNGGETRGSYDGKPEREGLRKAGYAVSRALAPAKAGG